MSKNNKNGLFYKRSKALFVAAILGLIYSIILIVYFGGSMLSGSSMDQFAGFLASAMVTPHIILVVVSTIFSFLGFFMRKNWAALVAAIGFTIGALLFIIYGAFCIPSIVLAFIGFANQKKLNTLEDKNVDFVEVK